MTVVSKSDLLTRANQVRTETAGFANTASRMGGLLRDIVDSIMGPVIPVVGLLLGDTDSNKTTNAAAILATVNALGLLTPNGGVVQLPAGVIVTSPVGIIYSNVWIRGAGIGCTKVKLGAASGGVDQGEIFRFGIAVGSGTPVAITNCRISDMEIDGNKANQVNGSDPAGSNAAAVGVATVAGMVIENLNVHDCDGYGISFFGTDFAGRSDWLVRNVETHHNNYDGVDIKGGSTNKPTRIVLDHVYSHDNGPGNIVGRDSVGFDLRGERITLIGCTANTNTQNGIRLRDGSDGCYSADLISCFADGNTTAGLQVDGVATGVYTVTGGRLSGNSAYGCRQEGGTLVMTGVTIRGQARGYTNFTTACRAELIGCVIEDNTDWGVRADVSGTRVLINGGVIRRSGREGVRAGCTSLRMRGVDVLDNDQGATNSAGILLLATVTDWVIEMCRSTNDAGTTQNYGVEFQAALGPGVLNALLTGNASGVTTGTMPVGTLYYGTAGRSVPVVV